MRAASRWPRARTGSSGPSPYPTPSSGGPTPWATSRSTTCTSRCGPRRDRQRRAPLAARAAHRRAPRLDRHGERRAPVPQGHERRPDPHGAGRGRARRDRRGHHAGPRRRARPRAGARPHQPARALRRRRRGRHAALAGPPLQWGYSRTVRQEARRQAREAVDLLAHHPSLFMWCGHNEPMAVDIEPATLADRRSRRRLACGWPRPRPCPAGTGRCSTGPSRRCSSVTTAPGRCWPTRACSPTCRSSTAPIRTSTSGGSSARSATCPGSWPDGHGWPASSASSGASPCPTTTASSARRWPDLDWDRLAEHHTLQKPMFDRHVPPAEFATYEDWKDATREYQARVVRYHVETLRRLKYHPPAASPSSAWPTAPRRSAARCSTTSGRRSPPSPRSATRAGP